MTISWIISQICNFIGYGVFIFAMYRNKKDKMLLTDAISRIFFITGWILLGSINGIMHSVFGIVRATIFRKLKRRRYIARAFVILFVIVIIMYGSTFSGISTVFFIISAIANLCGAAFGNEQGVRIATVAAALCNIGAFTSVSNYVGAGGEIIVLIMTIIAFMTNRKKFK